MKATRADSVLPADLDARLRGTLGMPFLPTIFSLLGDHQSYLLAATEAFLAQPPDWIDEHARATRGIGSRTGAALVHRPLDTGPSTASLGALIDIYNQVNPPSLLFTQCLWPGTASPFAVMEPPFPAPPSPDDGDALLADIRACHGDFNVPGFWRELEEGWPEHAAPAWALVRRLSLRAEFARAREAVRALTREKLAGRAVPAPRDLGCSAAQAREIELILAFYAVVIPTMVVEIECLRRAVLLSARDDAPTAPPAPEPSR